MKMIHNETMVLLVLDDDFDSTLATKHMIFEGTQEEIDAEIERLGLTYHEDEF